MGKGSASAGALTPLRPVSELLDHLREVTGVPVDAAVLTYVSDLFTGAGGMPGSHERVQATIDHALWLHRPSRAGEWVLMDLAPRAVSRGRSMYDGTLWRPDGTLVASLTQETLYRRRRR